MRVLYNLFNWFYSISIDPEICMALDENILVNGKPGNQSGEPAFDRNILVNGKPGDQTPEWAYESTYKPSLSENIEEKYGVTQPDNSEGNLSNQEKVQKLADYLDQVAKDYWKNGAKRRNTIRATQADLTDENKRLLRDIIRNNPDSPAYNSLVRRSGPGSKSLCDVAITQPLIKLIRESR